MFDPRGTVQPQEIENFADFCEHVILRWTPESPQILPDATVEEFVPKHASQYIEIEQASFIERHAQ